MKKAKHRGFASQKTVGIGLALIILLGLGLRVIDLGGASLWLDEGVSAARAGSSLARLVAGSYPDPSPPLYYLILHFWIRVFGDSEFSIRFPSVIFGTLAIFLIYRFGAVFFNRKTGLIAAVFLALAAFPVYFSREARMYSLLLFLSLISYYYLGMMIRHGARRAGVWYLLATAGVLYTHNLGISTVLAQNIFLLIAFIQKGETSKLTARRWYTIQGALGLLYLPGLALVIQQWSGIRGGYWSPPLTAMDLGRTIQNFAGSAPAAVICSIAAAAAFLPSGIGAGSSPARGKNDLFSRGNLLLASWLLTPIILPFLISMVSTPIYIARITIAAAPAFYLLAARGVMRFAGRGKRIALTGIIGLLLLSSLRQFYRPGRNEPWREVTRLVETEAEPNDRILISPPWYRRLCFDYYRTRNDLTIRGVPEETFNETGIPKLKDEAERYPRVWIIYFQERDLSLLLEKNFPERFSPKASQAIRYYNFQAGRAMTIRVYLLNSGSGN